jgi:uncharacterized protein (DUF427 family)
MRVKAIWNDTVLAESDDTVVVEGDHYFPRESLVGAHFAPGSHWSARTPPPAGPGRSVRGRAWPRTITVDGAVNPDAAWEYQHPSVLARKVKGRVAFWHGVELVADDASSVQAASL